MNNPFGNCANCIDCETCALADHNVNNCERYQELCDNIQKYISNKIYELLSTGKVNTCQEVVETIKAGKLPKRHTNNTSGLETRS